MFCVFEVSNFPLFPIYAWEYRWRHCESGIHDHCLGARAPPPPPACFRLCIKLHPFVSPCIPLVSPYLHALHKLDGRAVAQFLHLPVWKRLHIWTATSIPWYFWYFCQVEGVVVAVPPADRIGKSSIFWWKPRKGLDFPNNVGKNPASLSNLLALGKLNWKLY